MRSSKEKQKDAAEFIRELALAKRQRIIRKPELQKMVSLSDSTIWRMEREGRFPKILRLGGNSYGWFESEVLNWMADLASAR